MKTDFRSKFICILILILLQTGFAMGQASSVSAPPDTSNNVKIKTQPLNSEIKGIFSIFKRKQKKEDRLKNDSLQNSKSDRVLVTKKDDPKDSVLLREDSVGRKKEPLLKDNMNTAKAKSEELTPLNKESFYLFKREPKQQDNFLKNDSLHFDSNNNIMVSNKDSLGNTGSDSVKNKNKIFLLSNKLNHPFHLKEGSITQGNDSLFKKNNADNLKNNFTKLIPGMDAKGKLSGGKEKLIGEKGNLKEKKEDLFNKKDSLISQNRKKLKSIDPIAFVKKEIKAIQPRGNIAVGYEYGVLPFIIGDNYPSGGYKTEGNISFLALGIPLEFTYYYTNIKNVVGLNNYFRLSYDADRYKDKLNEKLGDKEQVYKNKLGKLQLQQQQLAQKIEYMNYAKEAPNYKSPINENVKNDFSLNSSLPDSGSLPNNLSNYGKTGDSLHSGSYSSNVSGNLKSNFDYSNKSDSTHNQHSQADSTNDYARKRDSISNQITQYKSKFDSVNKAIIEVKKDIDQISNYEDIAANPSRSVAGKTNNSYFSKYGNPYLSKVQRVMSYVKKFEIGLCHPTSSTFLVNNIPLQGINFEFAKKNNFLAFTYGTTINNLLYNTNTVQGAILGARNLYNYFDFSKLEAGRKILSLKGGVGAKDDTHLYVGFLLGKGRTDYLIPTPPDPSSASLSKESNVVVELDAKYKFSQNLNVDFIMGKSSVKEEDISLEQIKRSVNEIFSNYRSYAILARVNALVKKTKTKLTFTTRWIDPYFKSFGIGFLRSDNLRYEIKAEQPITSKIKYTIAFKREEDNLLKLYDYKNILLSINNSLNIKLNRQFNLRLMYCPLFREFKSSSYSVTDKNNISTVILSYMPKAKRINAQFNCFYSRYIISGDSSKINFENFTYTQQLIFKSGFKTDLNVSWFKNNLTDTLGNNTYLGVLDIGYTNQKVGSFVIGGKAAYKRGIEPQIGFLVKISAKVYKGLYFETEVEKIIIGDYYNSFIIEKIKKFPYYSNAKLVYNF